jgi:hypothetical protein
MSPEDALQRTWFVFYVGLFALAATGLQLWTGYTLEKVRGLVSRKKDPSSFWMSVILTGALAAFCFGLAFIGFYYPSLLPR